VNYTTKTTKHNHFLQETVYLNTLFCRCFFPLQATPTTRYSYCHSDLNLTIDQANSLPLPAGKYPRLLNIFICTYIKTQLQPTLTPNSISQLFKYFKINKRGPNQKIFTQQLTSWLKCPIYLSNNHTDLKMLNNNASSPQAISIDSQFFAHTQKHSLPLSGHTVWSLKNSPLALDVYCWLAYRLPQLNKPLSISWPRLITMFTPNIKYQPMAKKKLIAKIQLIKEHYPSAQFHLEKKGIIFLGLLKTVD
jgi:hypothetical protein